MSLFPCPRCTAPVISGHISCPHCHATIDKDDEIRAMPLLLMGLLLSGCGDKDTDTDTEPEDTAVGQDLYGVPALDDEEAGEE